MNRPETRNKSAWASWSLSILLHVAIGAIAVGVWLWSKRNQPPPLLAIEGSVVSAAEFQQQAPPEPVSLPPLPEPFEPEPEPEPLPEPLPEFVTLVMRDGWDSILSILQMPNGVPVATVALNAAKNAGILAAQIIGAGDAAVLQRVAEDRRMARTHITVQAGGMEVENYGR